MSFYPFRNTLFFTLLMILCFPHPSNTQEDNLADYSLNDEVSFGKGLYVKEASVEDELKFLLEDKQEHKNRFELALHLNHKPNEIADLLSFEGAYANHRGDYWYHFYLSYTRATFEALTVKNAHLAATSDDILSTNETLLSFGMGVSFRDDLIRYLIKGSRLYSSTGAMAGWYRLNETLTGETYSGPGFKAEYGIFRPSSDTLHYGLKASYHHALVKRPAAFDGESSNHRSLNLSWLSIAFDVRFYY